MKKKNRLRKTAVMSIITLFLLFLSTAVFASAPPPPPPSDPGDLTPGVTHDISIKFNDGFNNTRTFKVYIPQGLTGPAPMVVDIHGHGGTSDIGGYHGIKALADEKGFIWVSPQGSNPLGLGNSWNGVVCCPGASAMGGVNVNDVGFIRKMVSWVKARADVDPDRVYAHGHSNGAALTHQLGLQAADIFAAIAPVSFPLVEYGVWSWPSQPVAVLQVLGNRDPLMFAGMLTLYGTTEDGFNDWAFMNGCAGWPFPSITQSWNWNAWRKTYCDCNGGVKVEMLKLDAGHAPYLTGAGDAWNDNGVDLAREIVDFFYQFSR